MRKDKAMFLQTPDQGSVRSRGLGIPEGKLNKPEVLPFASILCLKIKTTLPKSALPMNVPEYLPALITRHHTMDGPLACSHTRF